MCNQDYVVLRLGQAKGGRAYLSPTDVRVSRSDEGIKLRFEKRFLPLAGHLQECTP